jgi:hypothetical protein
MVQGRAGEQTGDCNEKSAPAEKAKECGARVLNAKRRAFGH